MIFLIEQGHDRMLFDNVTHVSETIRPSVLGGTRKVINLYNGDQVLAGGDAIDPMTTKLTLLPYAEREDN
jgi:hypothetical protein